MRIETYIPGLSKNTIEIVKHAESLGYDALVSGELNNEPFLPVLLGLEHSKKMILIHESKFEVTFFCLWIKISHLYLCRECRCRLWFTEL